jgi:hypothetical protein
VYVAGRRLRGAGGDEQPIELIVAGLYRWIPIGAPAAIEVDGRTLAPGQVVAFEAGAHTVRFPAAVPDGALVLALDEPPRDAPLPFYKGY